MVGLYWGEWGNLVLDVIEDHDVLHRVPYVNLGEYILLLDLELDRVLQSMEPDVHYLLIPGCEQQFFTTRHLHVGVLLLHLPRLLRRRQDSNVLDTA